MIRFIGLLGECIDQGMIPGYALGLIDGDQVQFLLEGTLDGQGSAVDQDVLYDIASLTKLFTTVRILQLCETNRLSLDMPVKAILHDFTSTTITIRDCLLHRTGFAPSASRRYTLHDDALLQTILGGEDIINPRDQVMVYSCINFILLGEVITAMDGHLQTSFNDHIFTPAGMKHAGFNPDPQANIAPTRRKDGTLQVASVNDSTARALSGVAGNAGLFVSLKDMVAFAQALLDGTLVNPSTIALLETTNVDGRSLGFNRDHGHLYHTGFTGPVFSLDFAKKTAFVLLTNRNIPNDGTAFTTARIDVLRAYYAID